MFSFIILYFSLVDVSIYSKEHVREKTKKIYLIFQFYRLYLIACKINEPYVSCPVFSIFRDKHHLISLHNLYCSLLSIEEFEGSK